MVVGKKTGGRSKGTMAVYPDIVDLTKLSCDEPDQLKRIFGALAGFGDNDAPDQAGEGAAQG